MKTFFKSNPFLNLLAGFLLFGILGQGLQAQEIRVERVQFPPGASTAAIEGSITGKDPVDYLLNVRKGQYMNVSMASENGGVYFNIMEPDAQYEAIHIGSAAGNQFEGVMNKSGDYRVRVYLMKGARNSVANYTLEMIVSGSE